MYPRDKVRLFGSALLFYNDECAKPIKSSCIIKCRKQKRETAYTYENFCRKLIFKKKSDLKKNNISFAYILVIYVVRRFFKKMLINKNP